MRRVCTALTFPAFTTEMFVAVSAVSELPFKKVIAKLKYFCNIPDKAQFFYCRVPRIVSCPMNITDKPLNAELTRVIAPAPETPDAGSSSLGVITLTHDVYQLKCTH